MVFARLCLLVLGYAYLSPSYVDLRRLRLVAASNREYKTYRFGRGIERGSLVVCNSSSFVQVLFLVYYFSPTFVDVVPGSDDVFPLGLWGALARTYGASPSGSKRAVPLNVFLESNRADGPVVLFPEGRARTNNLGLLRFEPVFGRDDGVRDGRADALIARLHLVAFRFPNKGSYSAAQPVDGMLSVVVRLCMEIVPAIMGASSMSASYAPDLVAAEGGTGRDALSPSKKLQVVRDLLAKAAGMKTVDLDARDYERFVKFYHEKR